MVRWCYSWWLERLLIEFREGKLFIFIVYFIVDVCLLWLFVRGFEMLYIGIVWLIMVEVVLVNSDDIVFIFIVINV